MANSKQKKMEFVPGYGYRWDDGSMVYQEEQLIHNTSLPLGHTNYGKPWSYKATELHIESMGDGFWIMDRLASYHKHPFKTQSAADRYLEHLRH